VGAQVAERLAEMVQMEVLVAELVALELLVALHLVKAVLEVWV
jgi:hypothetical protein